MRQKVKRDGCWTWILEVLNQRVDIKIIDMNRHADSVSWLPENHPFWFRCCFFSLATTLALIALCFGDQVLVLAHFLSESGCFIWVAFAAPVCSLLRHDESHIFYLNQNAFLPLLS